MNITNNKIRAKEVLSNNFWGIVGGYALYSVIVGLTSSVFVGVLLLGVITFGYQSFILNASRGDEVKIERLFCAFNDNFVRACIAGLLQILYIFLWSLLLLIPGIIKSYSYSMMYFIMNEDPEISANDAITKSREMMNGHKKELFLQDLSFIGWILLSCLTFGILMFWVEPYMHLARAEFYNKLKNEEV